MRGTKDGELIEKGRLFQLVREVTGENDEGLPTVRYGGYEEIVVVTGEHMTANSFEVLPLNRHQFSDNGFYSSFVVTLDDVTSVEEKFKESEYDYANELLREYDKYKVKHKDQVYSELEYALKTSLDHGTKEQILEFLDSMVELKGGYYAFGYVDREGH